MPLEKKKIELMAIAKTSYEDFREIKSAARNYQTDLIFKMVRIMMSNPSDIAYCFIFNFFINQRNRYVCLFQSKSTPSSPQT